VGRNNGPGASAQGFLYESPVTKMPGRRLYARPPAAGIFSHPAGLDAQHPAGDAQAGAKDPYRPGIPLAFLRGADSVFHMGGPEGKIFPFPEPGKGSQHGGGIGPSGNRGQQAYSRGQGTQTFKNSGFKGAGA
jgi:hypothetical protein